MLPLSLVIHLVVMGLATVLSIVAIAIAKSKMPFKNRIALHKLTAGLAAGLILLAIAGLAMIGHLYPSLAHFYTGLSAALVLVAAVGGGLMVLNTKQADRRKKLRSTHVAIGALFTALMLLTIALGLAVFSAFSA